MNTLDRYLGRAIVLHAALVAAVLIALTSLFVFLGQQDDIGVGNYGVGDAFIFTLLSMPQQLFEMLPVAVLIGAFLALGNLARDNELTVMRSVGRSPWQLARSAGLAGVVLMAVMVLLGEYVAPPADQYARQLKIFSKYAEYTAGGGRSTWVRDGNLFINVGEQRSDTVYGGLEIIELDADGRLASAGLADTARHEGGDRWLFGNFRATRFADGRTHVESAADRPLEVRVNPDFLGLAIVSPDALPVAGLLGYVRHLKQNRLDAQAFEIALWSRISRTVAVVLVCMLAVPFALGPLRSAGAGARMVVGILLGVLFFLLNRTLENSGQVFDLSPALAGWAPTLLLALLTWLALARASKA